MSLPTVGFLGLGAMGGGMSKHLLKQGFQVTGYDVYQPLITKLVEAGGNGASSPLETGKAADVLVLMVTSASQVSTVLFDGPESAVPGLRQNAAIVISSTVPPKYCNELRARLDNEANRPDVFLLDCPVSGGTPRAASGDLSIFSSGPEEGLAKAHSVLETLSAALYKIPGGIGFGSRAKMCHQVLPEVEIALANEAMALAAKVGLNTQEVFDAVQKGEGWSWINGNRIPHMLEGDQSIYSVIPNSQKDSVKETIPEDLQKANRFSQSIIVSESREVAFPVFLIAVAEQVYQAGINAGWAKEDDSTLWRLFLPNQPNDTIYQMTKHDSTLIARNEAVSVQDIIDIFVGGHLAAAAEAMGFTEAVGLDTDVMYDIISKAAGSNTQFVDNVPVMKKPAWSLRDVPCARDVCQRLENALIKANSVGASMPMAAASLQLIKWHLL